jgi:RNA polymerase sigma factor (sigma-70 family)
VEAAALHRLAAREHDPSRARGGAAAGQTPRRRFESLLDRHETMLRRVAFGMLGDPHRVDDVLQEALLKAYRKLPSSFESERQEAVWLYRIVHRCCLDELRGRRRRPEVVGEVERSAASEPDSSLAVAAALARLTPDGRAVVLLVDLIGLDYASAAAALGIPRGTVASRLNAARNRLREVLDA